METILISICTIWLLTAVIASGIISFGLGAFALDDCRTSNPIVVISRYAFGVVIMFSILIIPMILSAPFIIIGFIMNPQDVWDYLRKKYLYYRVVGNRYNKHLHYHKDSDEFKELTRRLKIYNRVAHDNVYYYGKETDDRMFKKNKAKREKNTKT